MLKRQQSNIMECRAVKPYCAVLLWDRLKQCVMRLLEKGSLKKIEDHSCDQMQKSGPAKQFKRILL